MQVSVIIPVYNCEKYIEKCLDSVCGQTLHDLEIICVDDGSTDSSYAILEDYAKRERRVKFWTQTNQGAGCARNAGMREAIGKYVIFLDGDDYYYENDALEKLWRTCEEKRVKACGSSLRLLRNGVVSEDVTLHIVKEAASRGEILEYKDFQFDYGYTGFLFFREMLLENDILFPSYRRFQDPPFLVRAMHAAEKFAFCDAALYCYRVPTMASRFNKEKVVDLLRGLRDNLCFAQEKNLDKLFHATLMRIEYEYYSVICRLLDTSDKEAIGVLEEIEMIVKCKCSKEYQLHNLEFLRDGDKSYFVNYEQKLLKKIMQIPAFYLYGAGGFARKFLKWSEVYGVKEKIKSIIVSQKADDQDFVEGIVVKAVDRLEEEEELPIVVAVGAIFHGEIVQELKKRNMKEYYLVDSVFLEELEV